MKAELARKEKHQAEELAAMKAAMMKMNEEKKQADAKIRNLEEAEASRTSRRAKRSRMRTISWNSSIPAKSANKEDTRLSNGELSYQKEVEDRKRRDVFTATSATPSRRGRGTPCWWTG